MKRRAVLEATAKKGLDFHGKKRYNIFSNRRAASCPSRKETKQMNKGFWQGIIGVTAIAVVGVAAWQFISLQRR